MFKFLRLHRAQSVLEYAFLIGVVAAALILGLIYFSRAFKGNLRSSADQMGEQYEPLGTEAQSTQTWEVNYNTTMNVGASKKTTSNTTSTMCYMGSEKTDPL